MPSGISHFTGLVQLPRQKVTISEKVKDNFKWAIETIDAIIGTSNFQVNKSVFNFGLGNQGYDVRQSTYDFYYGIINDYDYTHVLKPYGKTRHNFPAKLHNYPIIKPIVDLLRGEYIKRPFNFNVSVSNPDVVTIKEQVKKMKIEEMMQSTFASILSELGITTQEGEESPIDFTEFEKAFERSYKDNREIMGQNILNYIVYIQDVQRKLRKGFFHFIVSGRVITEKEIIENEVIYNVLDPQCVDYERSDGVEFIEDSRWGTVRKYLTPNDVVDAYHKYLSDEQIDQLENENTSGFSDIFSFSYSGENVFDDENEIKTRLIEVIKVYWKTFVRYGIVIYSNPITESVESKIVEDGYKKQPEDIDISWYWKSETWSGIRIDGDIYIKIGPHEVQRNSLDNRSTCKLPINGRTMPISLVMLGIPFQISYNIYMYRLEVSIAKARGMIAQIDMSLIPSKLDMDQWLYYIDVLGIAFTDYSSEGSRFNPQHQTQIDLTFKEIERFIKLLEFILEAWERLSGVTRQRQGAIGQYDLVGNTEQSIVQSSHITEDYFQDFSEFMEKEFEGLLDFSKIAYMNGKKAMYMSPDYTNTYLSIDGIQNMETEYGISVHNGPRERQKIEQLRNLATPLIQNGAPLSTIADLFRLDSFSELSAKIKETEADLNNMRKEAEEAQLRAMQEGAEMERQIKLEEMSNENEQNQLDRDNKIEIAIIQAASKTAEDNSNDLNNLLNKYGIDEKKLIHDRIKNDKDRNLKRKMHEDKMTIEKKKLSSNGTKK